MHRLLVALLTAFDALIAVAVALAAALATLTLLWVFGLGAADWSALWPAAASVWQIGNLVPLPISLPDAYLVDAGIATDAASFVISLAPLGFAAFTVIFAARSGGRAAGAGAPVTGMLAGSVVFGALAAAVALTSGNTVARPELWQAILLPTAVYAAGVVVGAIVGAWRHGDDGIVDRVHEWVDDRRGGWDVVPGLAVRGAAAACAGLIGLGALAVLVSLMTRGSEVIALYEAGGFDGLGAALVTVGQLAYLPTLIVWGLAWIAGPGFALGPGTAVSPSGTQLGVVPGIPLLGAVPESVSPWLLLVLLLPIGVGALAGWIVRSRLVAPVVPDPVPESTADLPNASHDRPASHAAHEPVGPRIVLTLLLAVLTGAVAALFAAVASGSMGPGRLAEVGPDPGPVALAIGVEVLVGAGILILSPRKTARERSDASVD